MRQMSDEAAANFEVVRKNYEELVRLYPDEPKFLVCADYWRAYGGPEEGGWYYDCTSTIAAVRVTEQSELADAYILMWDTFNSFKNRYDNLTATLGELEAGDVDPGAAAEMKRARESGRRIFLSEEWPAESTPDRRPHYE